MITERDCIRYSIHLPEVLSNTDVVKRNDLKELILKVSPYTVIRQTELTCIIEEGEVPFVKWTVSVSLNDAEKLFNLITWWADEYVSARNDEKNNLDKIMLERELVKKVYMG